jgi:23S rRNA (uridine2552-2'-O)-methyltransferase
MKQHTVDIKKRGKKKATSKDMNFQFNNHIESVKNAKKRTASSNVWLARRNSDPFVKASKIDGYLSRAAYKLLEMQQRYKLFTPSQIVIDLGAAPGSFMQVIWNIIRSKKSILIGVDLLEIPFQDYLITDKLADNVHFLCGDFLQKEMQDTIHDILEGKKADVVISDMASNTIGVESADHLAIMGIVQQVVDFAHLNLKQGGSLLCKIFQGAEQNDFFHQLKAAFNEVHFVKPKASRPSSSEVYVLAIDKKS